MPNTYASELSFVHTVLCQAAAVARQIQTDIPDMRMTKADLSPVTVADFAVQAIVARALAQSFPGLPLVAEERAARLREPEHAAMLDAVTRYVRSAIPGAGPGEVCDWIDRGTAAPAERYWALDPIDGTKGFSRGGQYAVALTLLERDTVRVGGLACPGLNDACDPGPAAPGVLALAERGGGAWRISLASPDATPRPLRVSEQTNPARARLLRSVELGHTNVTQIEAIAARLGVTAEPAPMDSQAKYLALAAGRAELMLRLPAPDRPDYHECIWDHAAGVLILEEAGGRVTDMHGKPFDYATGRKLLHNQGVCASNGALHAALMEAVTQALSRA